MFNARDFARLSGGSSGSDNSAISVNSNPLEGSTNFGGTGFGDWFLGQSGQKEQATRQSQLDYEQWLRNEYSAKAQREFEEYMSNTQVQRSMADLKAAGLNPWLAVQSAGFGGSVPSGAAASSAAGQATAGSSGSALQNIGTSALGIAALIKVIAKLVK